MKKAARWPLFLFTSHLEKRVGTLSFGIISPIHSSSHHVRKQRKMADQMKWKKQIWVFDDIIPIEQQETIKNTLLGPQFPWRFVDDVTGGGSQDKRPAFSHTFISDGAIRTNQAFVNVLQPLWKNCMGKVMEKTSTQGNYSALKARSFLQLPLANLTGSEYDSHHIDMMQEHFAFLYYVCDSDGDTVLFENMYSRDNPNSPEPGELKEKMRVTPKQGRVVIFDGYYWHTATQPSKGIRCVINTDVVQNV
jgi:hypothetical protein